MNRIMIQDDGHTYYNCNPDECEYSGEFYCQNCGFSLDELRK